MRKIIAYISSTLMLLPFGVFAASVKAPRDFKGLVGVVTDLISTIIVLIFALTFLVFMWGIIKNWVIKRGEAEAVESGKKIVVTGIIALVVMSSIWGILYLLQSSFFGS
ncbi:MAG: hypothetical protein K9M10_02350 [Candidatus Pacebacteria bacterium]|nr:hypothetical protein [Candidatus Paceibacterota bacterium]MCF7857296.1 hypothetical protein [Candidatus Paceibacterota bacterium]